MKERAIRKTDDVDIRSEEIEDILGRSPGWMTRYGVVLLATVIIAVIAGSWFFRYPDKIQSAVIITSSNVPAHLLAKTDARIAKIFVDDKQMVSAGDTLAFLESTASFDDVKAVMTKLDSLKPFILNFDELVICNLSENYELGDLQDYYSAFRSSYRNYVDLVTTDYYTAKAGLLEQRVAGYDAVRKKLINQEMISSAELDLSNKKFLRDSALHANSVIAESDLDNTRNDLLQNKYSLLTSGTGIDNALIEAGETSQALLELEKEYSDKKKEYELALSTAYDNLKAQIEQWTLSYLLITPVAGQVSFSKFWKENQNVITGDKICTVVPEGESKVSARLSLPIAGSGKVKEGQKVNIRLDNFPYMEYGSLQGIVRSVSPVPADNSYTVDVDLPEGLRTSYGKELGNASEMQGTAEIITDDLRLIERLIMPLRYLADK